MDADLVAYLLVGDRRSALRGGGQQRPAIERKLVTSAT